MGRADGVLARFARVVAIAVAIASGGAVLCAARTAEAQTHYDVGVEGGVLHRFLAGRPDGGDDAGFGPFVEVHAHVALLPLVRVGAYGSFDVSPLGSLPARRIGAFGARVKIASPIPDGDFRLSFFTGFGYALAYAPSGHLNVPLQTGGGSPTPTDVAVDGDGGAFFEVPFGVEGAFLVHKPISITVELFGRACFGTSGNLYVERSGTQAGGAPVALDPAGTDAIALGLAVGVSFQP